MELELIITLKDEEWDEEDEDLDEDEEWDEEDEEEQDFQQSIANDQSKIFLSLCLLSAMDAISYLARDRRKG